VSDLCGRVGVVNVGKRRESVAGEMGAETGEEKKVVVVVEGEGKGEVFAWRVSRNFGRRASPFSRSRGVPLAESGFTCQTSPLAHASQ
jgi:hypothetical protein